MLEPLAHFLNKEGFDRSAIADWVIGDMYVGLLNTDGQVGICATLGTEMNDRLFYEGNPDLNDPVHRIILNAWFSSVCNYRQEYPDIVDIFDSIDFSEKPDIVMVGYFESLFEKFSKAGIRLQVFDIQKESHILTDLSEFDRAVQKCQTMVLTGTTIFNSTFLDIVNRTSDDCSIYLLGPSNILSEDMFMYRNIKVVFGSVFGKNDTRVFKKIKEGHGTRSFQEYLDKVYIRRETV